MEGQGQTYEECVLDAAFNSLLQDKQKNSSALDKFLLSFFIQQFGEESVVRRPAMSNIFLLQLDAVVR